MNRARYDEVADFYAAEFSSAADPVSQALLQLLGPVTGLRVLDVACGHGRITREVARRGANVTGVDLSGRLISKAVQAEQDEQLGVRYVHADITEAAAAVAAGFDAATCHFGLSDIDDLQPAAAVISGLLRPAGRFVFSIVHPCFPGGREISGSWPRDGRYYDEGHWTAEGRLSSLRRRVGAIHRMLSTYLNTFRQHDLWLDQIAEPLPAPGWDPDHEADSKPVYLVVRMLKLASTAP